MIKSLGLKVRGHLKGKGSELSSAIGVGHGVCSRSQNRRLGGQT